jgi:hypothetical protein
METTKQAQTTPNTDEDRRRQHRALLRPIPFASVRASTPCQRTISNMAASGHSSHSPGPRLRLQFDGEEDTGKSTLGNRMQPQGRLGSFPCTPWRMV